MYLHSKETAIAPLGPPLPSTPRTLSTALGAADGKVLERHSWQLPRDRSQLWVLWVACQPLMCSWDSVCTCVVSVPREARPPVVCSLCRSQSPDLQTVLRPRLGIWKPLPRVSGEVLCTMNQAGAVAVLTIMITATIQPSGRQPARGGARRWRMH